MAPIGVFKHWKFVGLPNAFYNKFTIYEADKLVQNNNYDYLSVTTKKNDKNYIITSISGSINYDELDYCLKKKAQFKMKLKK